MYNKKVVFRSACLGIFLFGIALISLGSLAPDLREKFRLDEIASGTLFSILPFGILAGSLVFGPIADRYGYRVLLALSCILLAAGFEGIAFSQGTGLLKVCIFLVGFSGGSINGATNALVSDISDRDKGANLSLLGVFFGIGALGMPMLLGILEKSFSSGQIIAFIGLLSFATGILFLLIKMPQPKQMQGFPLGKSLRFLNDRFIILVAFFLFFQSSFEGIINNWTTTYLIDQAHIPQGSALFTLSMFVAGMAIMRLVTGTALRNVPVGRILVISFAMIIAGLIIIRTGEILPFLMTGFFLLGAGLAGGFPVMLGFVGEAYADLSGTAFSFVLFIALLGNMLINYAMGIISKNFGISHLITVAFCETIIMIALLFCILKLKKDKSMPA
ncbi:MAG TPA: MFS transporter [Bacteroidales bacterium]|nr:MFS transporter [Bacteroidales bacterium]HNR40657.1 MFS transporter [Bacteroidales bacterium]HPM17713.1 MFS transporter [Bacteroidales bacterium]HQG77819.1 MFS transporter [Bacteroidales bacterium]